ncbi:MAG TPA: hypothetical protein VLK58_23655, partial [Conexibacter sp.]|nr:hypothetical protein [Conexibacter sp.]
MGGDGTGAGDVGASCAGASGAAPSAVRNVASGAPTGTRVPGSTSSRSISPSWKISISISALLVSTDATTSPR